MLIPPLYLIILGHIVQYVNRTICPAVFLVRVIRMKLRIRDLREDRDMKQKEVAAYLMCDQSLYSKYEREERPLPLEMACKLADLYNVSVDYLVCRTNEKQPYPKK
jgi:ribosome-binding protein aMBF1 (putative translation factor)